MPTDTVNPRRRDTRPATLARVRKAEERRFTRYLTEMREAGWTVQAQAPEQTEGGR